MEAISRTIQTFDWMTIAILLSLIFLVLSKQYFYSRFLSFMILPFNNRYIVMYNKKDRLINGFQLFFTLFQALNLALFICLASGILLQLTTTPSLLDYLIILGGVLGFLLAKILVQMGNGLVFNNGKVISEFIFKKLSYFNYSGLIVFLANIILVYIKPDSPTVVYSCIFLVILVNAIGWITLLKNHQKLITTYFFYFILYLCALEIAPLVLIANALTELDI